MPTFNMVRITQLDAEITTLKMKTYLILNVLYLYEHHFHHVEENYTRHKHYLPIYLNPTSGSPPKWLMQFKRNSNQSFTIMKMSSSWHNTTVWHQELSPMTFWMASFHTWLSSKEKEFGPFGVICIGPIPYWSLAPIHSNDKWMNTDFACSNCLQCQPFGPVLVPATAIHFNFASNILVMPDVRATNLLTIGHYKSFETISSFDLHSCHHLSDTFFCKGRKVIETSLKRSSLGTLPGQLGGNSIQLQVQNCISQGEKFLMIMRTVG